MWSREEIADGVGNRLCQRGVCTLFAPYKRTGLTGTVTLAALRLDFEQLDAPRL